MWDYTKRSQAFFFLISTRDLMFRVFGPPAKVRQRCATFSHLLKIFFLSLDTVENEKYLLVQFSSDEVRTDLVTVFC